MSGEISQERRSNALILVVDDVALNRKVLSQSLLGHGYSNVIVAGEGSEAMQLTQERKPDLVVLDLMMPGMDGYAYLQAIRQDTSYDHMPIIVQTALHEMENKIRAFSLGATDYICKPINPAELGARTKVALNQKFLMEDLNSYKARITDELHAARQMQQRLMPAEAQVHMCERIYDLKIATYFETSSALGGDCWGMRPLSDHRLAIYMYDFSGHGMGAAMNVFRMHTIMQEFIHTGGDPGHFLATLNRHLHSLLERNEFATMFYGIIDTAANCLVYSSAAAPPALLHAGTESEPIMLSGRGFPLGVLAGANFETKYTAFAPGDTLMLYSDCLTESGNKNGEIIEEQELKNILKTAAAEKPQNLAQATIDAVMKYFTARNTGPIRDDITLNVYSRNMV